MKQIQKNGKNKWKPTQNKKSSWSGMGKQKLVKRKGKKPRKIHLRQMRIIVSDESQIVPAEILGKSHYPGKVRPGFKVIVSENPEATRRRIGAKKAIVYPIAA